MNKRAVLHLVSFMTLVVGLSIVGCALVSLLCGDARAVQLAFLESGGLADAKRVGFRGGNRLLRGERDAARAALGEERAYGRGDRRRRAFRAAHFINPFLILHARFLCFRWLSLKFPA